MTRKSFWSGVAECTPTVLPGLRFGRYLRPAGVGRSGPAPPPGPYSGTPLARAESIISDALAEDVVEQQDKVQLARSELGEQRRSGGRDPQEVLRLEWAVAAAERYLAVVRRRQAAWRRERAFDRNLVERVLVMARITDLREGNARARHQPAAVGDIWSRQPHLTALTAYLRSRHPPVC